MTSGTQVDQWYVSQWQSGVRCDEPGLAEAAVARLGHREKSARLFARVVYLEKSETLDEPGLTEAALAGAEETSRAAAEKWL